MQALPCQRHILTIDRPVVPCIIFFGCYSRETGQLEGKRGVDVLCTSAPRAVAGDYLRPIRADINHLNYAEGSISGRFPAPVGICITYERPLRPTIWVNLGDVDQSLATRFGTNPQIYLSKTFFKWLISVSLTGRAWYCR